MLFTFSLVSLHGAGSKAKGLVVSFHLEGQAEDTEKFVTPVKLGSEHRQYYFRKMPSFTNLDMQWFYPFVAQDGASYGAAFRLKNHKAQELTGITIANQGKLLGVRVLDAPLQALVIDRPVNDGILVVWGGLSKNHIQLIGSKLTHVDELTGQQTSLEQLPSFNVPRNQRRGAANAAAATAPNQNLPTANEAPKRKGFKLFGNANRAKKEPTPVNPYVNPPQ